MPTPPATSPYTRWPVVYQDDFLIVADKPADVLSHPNAPAGPEGGGGRAAFLGPYDLAERRFDTPAGPAWLIHRLDRDTSGLLLATRDADTAARCRALFESSRITKTYLALVGGRPTPPAGVWRDCLVTRRDQGRAETTIDRGGPPNAELRYRVQRNLPGQRCALLELTLVTGRTHQIRVQAAARRLPVAGDRVYGDFVWNRELRDQAGLRRLFLHAWKLAFAHPRTGRPLQLLSPLPAPLETCLDRLR